MKKTLSLLLSLIVILSIFTSVPLTANAATNGSAQAVVDNICNTAGFRPNVDNYSDCYAYVSTFCNKMYGSAPGGVSGYNLTRPGDFYLVGQTYGTGVTEASVASLLSRAMPGDVVQMYWLYDVTNYKHGPHTAIVYSADSTSFTILQDGASFNTIKKSTYAYSSYYTRWRGSGFGISLYRHSNYNNLFSTNLKPSNAWVSLPNGNESSYRVNTDVPIKIGADNARYYTIVMYRNGEHYYEDTFYNESGSHTIPASFDKTGHYSCYVIARYDYNGDYVTSSWQGWDIVDNVPQNLTVSINKPLDRDFYPGETVKVTANAMYGYQKYVCVHRADGSFYTGNYVNGTDFSCVINEPGEYYVNFEAFNACGSNLSSDLYFTVADDNAYIILPESEGYSYSLNVEVPMKMVAPGATHFRIIMEKDGEFYYEALFYNESGSHTIPTSFDKTGHYTGYLIATNNSGLEVVSDVYSWDVVNDVPQNLSISTNKSVYFPGEKIEFTMQAVGGQKKYIGIHRADGSFFNGSYLIGNDYNMIITAPGDYYADFEAINVYGKNISRKVYFSVKEIHTTTEETLIDYSKHLIYTDVQNCSDVLSLLDFSDDFDVSISPSQNLEIYGTGTIILIYDEDIYIGSFNLVVNGDTNGDSVCDVLDCAEVERVSNGNDSLSGVFTEAGDTNGDGIIDITDYQAIVNKAVY